MKLKGNMFMNILVRIKKCLLLAIILLNQNIMMICSYDGIRLVAGEKIIQTN